jgi:hypothetical protein
MNGERYRILTNRKRALVALAHTVVFLVLAVATGGMRVSPWHVHSPASEWILPGVYVVVTSVLLMLTVGSRGAERLYFAFCAASAAFGLARQAIGDPPLHVAVGVRVAMLLCAVLTGTRILRGFAARAEAG